MMDTIIKMREENETTNMLIGEMKGLEGTEEDDVNREN
jgi:hypothetical protein